MKTYSFSEPLLPNPIWVSPNGSDEFGDGTEERPFRQIQHAIDVSDLISERDIYVKEGSYNNFDVILKNVNIVLLGDVTLNGGILARDLSHSTIRSYDKNSRRKLKLNFDVGGTSCIVQNPNSTLFIDDIDFELNGDANDSTSFLFTYGICRIQNSTFSNYTGKKLSVIINCYQFSNVIIFNFQCTNASGGTIFCFANKGNLRILNDFQSPLLISNKYDSGIISNSGIVQFNTSSVTNNSPTPMSVSNGGRIFTESSATSMLSMSNNQNQIVEIEDIENINSDLYNLVKNSL